ncbi:kelch-like protein 10 [Folsomia candida]|nr:kelch-like protein 10 [Folsomia candida]
MEASPTLRLTTVDSKTLKCLIDFAYTGQFEKSLDTVTNLLQVATKFKMVPVMQQCCAYLIEKMTPDNTLRLYRLGRPYFCPKLETKAKTYILHNFRRVIGTQDFLELEPEELKVILLDDYLNVRNEAMVFEAIRAWVEAYPHRRRKYVAEMLSCVRFGLMSYGYFSNVVYQWHFVNEDEAVRSVLDAPYVLLTSIDSLNNTEVDLNDPLARPRIPYEVIFAVGGWSAGSPTAFIETYDIRADRWFLLNNTDSTPRAYHGLVAVGHFVYMIGGFDGQEHFSTVKRYDPVRQIWEERSCMLLPRCYVSCCSLDGIIYACGGYNGRTRMASGERYDPALNQWEMISSMNRQRSDASAASLRGKVYIAGGFTGTEVLISVETYDPAEDQWTFIQPMNTPRSGISLVAYRDCLYAVGGFNGFNRLNTAERYDPEEPGPWRMIPDMSSARSNFAAVCADELLICIGGFNGATTIPYVECYDSKVNEWFDGSHMNLNRSALSACVVTNLPNARDYSYLHRIQELLGLPNRENSP